ncbi:hypothetical protein ZWY2020_021428 [Hordeum vulgare]|nr:hypothetical protein ZWY2020_021428 [Hordeum vulgare]
MLRAQVASPNLGPTAPFHDNKPAGATHDCPSFDLNKSFHEDESTKRVVSASMKPRNLDVSLADTGDDWGLDLDPEVLQEVCYKEEMEFAKRKEKERSEIHERAAKQSRYSDQDVKNPAQTTTAATTTVGIASSSRTPAAAAHERRVLRVPAQLRSPYVDPQNADPFYCSKEISFPTLEILYKENPKETGHYWVLVLNIRDKRFEVLDSARTLKDKAFLATTLKIIDGTKANWGRHYNSSSV